MKAIIIYFILITTVFGIKLKNGSYSVVENVVRGKKWRTKVDMRIENNQVNWIDIDMVTKDGKLISQDKKELQVVLKKTRGVDPYIELSKEYMKKIKEPENYRDFKVDTIAGATAICNKVNKMTVFLIKKSEEGKTGEFEGWFY